MNCSFVKKTAVLIAKDIWCKLSELRHDAWCMMYTKTHYQSCCLRCHMKTNQYLRKGTHMYKLSLWKMTLSALEGWSWNLIFVKDIPTEKGERKESTSCYHYADDQHCQLTEHPIPNSINTSAEWFINIITSFAETSDSVACLFASTPRLMVICIIVWKIRDLSVVSVCLKISV